MIGLARTRADLQRADSRAEAAGSEHLRFSRLCRYERRHIRANLVPVGEDQASHLELSREITRPFQRPVWRGLPGAQGPVHSDAQGAGHGPPQDVEILPQRHRPGRHAGRSAPSARACSPIPRVCGEQDAGHRSFCNLFAFHQLVSPPEVQEKVAHDCRLAQIGCVDDKALIADELIATLEPIRKTSRSVPRPKRQGELLNVLRKGSREAARACRGNDGPGT